MFYVNHPISGIGVVPHHQVLVHGSGAALTCDVIPIRMIDAVVSEDLKQIAHSVSKGSQLNCLLVLIEMLAGQMEPN